MSNARLNNFYKVIFGIYSDHWGIEPSGEKVNEYDQKCHNHKLHSILRHSSIFSGGSRMDSGGSLATPFLPPVLKYLMKMK